MTTRHVQAIAVALGAIALLSGGPDLRAQAGSPAALSGVVSSTDEGAMEGVLVTARRADAPFSVTVTSDEEGRYRFPRTHLKPGTYSLQVRATGYDLEGARPVQLTLDTPAAANLTLRKTRDLAAQLTSQEWVISAPGTAEQKNGLVRQVVNCGFCHTLERVMRSRYTAEEWVPVIERMASYHPDFSGSRRIQTWGGLGPKDMWWNIPVKELATYLASVNLSRGDTWTYPLRPLPRPTGRATRAIVTVYDIPRQPSVIHDLDVDPDGNVWYGNSGHDYLGKLEPGTAAFAEYPAPNFSGTPPSITGLMDVQVDPDGNVWANVRGPKLARFNTRTQTWSTFKLPQGTSAGAFLAPFRALKTVWTHSALRLDAETGKVDAFDWRTDAPAGPHTGYVLDRDSKDNGYLTDYGRMGYEGSYIIRIDAKTGDVEFHATPTPEAFPRRGYIDSFDRFWFGEFFGDRIGMFDTRTKTFKEFPTKHPFSAPYYARPDKSGDIWASSNGTDRLLRLDPDTGDILEYPMPVYYDARKVVTDPSTEGITVWLPNKNTAQLIRVEVPD
jgi:streptogramin lyase